MVDFSPTDPQSEMIVSKDKFILFCGGLGSGKSEAMHWKAVKQLIDANNRKTVIGIYSATYDLLRLNNIPRMEQILEEAGIYFNSNKSSHIITTSIGNFIFRSMENPARIIAYETLHAHCDELDTLPTEKASEAWNKIIGRNRQRIKENNSLIVNTTSAYSTPEGFRFCYQKWVKTKSKGYSIISAPTTSNEHLPSDYVDSLYESYPKELAQAYIEGKFVNLTSGSVYNAFNRNKNKSNRLPTEQTLYVGMDFNVARMSAVILIKDQHGYFHAVDELTGIRDTPSMIATLLECYQHHNLIIYPDAASRARKSVNAGVTDLSQLKEYFDVRHTSKNPLIKDRVNCVNNAFEKNKLRINIERCPTLADYLEQQVYTKNGMPDKESGQDDLLDALGYAIHQLMPIIKPISQTQMKGIFR